MEKCKVCHDRGFLLKTTHEFSEHTNTVTKKCGAKGCYHGWYDIPHKSCEGNGCSDCSTIDKHGIAGKQLCDECGGVGCAACYNRGIVRVPCRTCLGSGKVTVTYHPYKRESVAIPCLKCALKEVKEAITSHVMA